MGAQSDSDNDLRIASFYVTHHLTGLMHVEGWSLLLIVAYSQLNRLCRLL